MGSLTIAGHYPDIQHNGANEEHISNFQAIELKNKIRAPPETTRNRVINSLTAEKQEDKNNPILPKLI